MLEKTLPKSSSELLPVGSLNVDRAYQRTVRKTQVRKIVTNYQPAAFGSLLVGRRSSGKLFVVDGQQRMTAAKQLNINSILCSVFESDGRAHEASIFKLVNHDRTGIASLQVYRACLWAGEKETLDIDAIVRECGFRVPQGSSRAWPNITSTGALYAIYRKKSGPSVLMNTLAVINDSWKKNDDALRSFVLSGTALFISREPEFDTKRLVKALKNVNPYTMLQDAESASKLLGRGRSDVFARAILKLYNKGLRNKITWD